MCLVYIEFLKELYFVFEKYEKKYIKVKNIIFFKHLFKKRFARARAPTRELRVTVTGRSITFGLRCGNI